MRLSETGVRFGVSDGVTGQRRGAYATLAL
jgi:hypothetical protein